MYAKILLHQIEEIANDRTKSEYMSSNLNNDINMTSRNGHCIKHVTNFKYIGSYVGSTERYIKIRIAQAWSALNSMNIIWKSKMSDKLKRNFFRSAIESIGYLLNINLLLYGSITHFRSLTSNLETKLAYTRMLRAALNTSWIVHMTNKELR